MLRNNAGSVRFDQSVRINTQAPSGMRPCRLSHTSICDGSIRNFSSAAASFDTSITTAGGAEAREIVRVAGAVGIILAGDPMNRRVEMRAGMFAHAEIVPVPAWAALV